MTLVKFNSDERNNGSSLPGFSDVFDSILSDTFFSDSLTSRVPAANISETEDHFHVELAAPGLKKENFKLNLDRDVLNISVGQHPEDYNQQKNYSKREYSYTSFVRSFTLPEVADQAKIEAEYTDGILKLNVAKKEEAKIQTREISVK